MNQGLKKKNGKPFFHLSFSLDSSPAQSLAFFFFFSPQPKPAQSFFLFLLSPTGRIPSRGPAPAPQPNSRSPPLSLTRGVRPSGASPTSCSNRTRGGARVRPHPTSRSPWARTPRSFDCTYICAPCALDLAKPAAAALAIANPSRAAAFRARCPPPSRRRSALLPR